MNDASEASSEALADGAPLEGQGVTDPSAQRAPGAVATVLVEPASLLFATLPVPTAALSTPATNAGGAVQLPNGLGGPRAPGARNGSTLQSASGILSNAGGEASAGGALQGVQQAPSLLAAQAGLNVDPQGANTQALGAGSLNGASQPATGSQAEANQAAVTSQGTTGGEGERGGTLGDLAASQPPSEGEGPSTQATSGATRSVVQRPLVTFPASPQARGSESDAVKAPASGSVKTTNTSANTAGSDVLAPLVAAGGRLAPSAPLETSASLLAPPVTPEHASGEGDTSPTTPLVARGLAALANQKGGALAIRLDPPSLGDLRIAMTVVNGRVTAELTTSTSRAQAILQADLVSLRQALESAGLAVDRISVQNAPPQQPTTSARAEHQPAPTQHATPQPAASSQQNSGSDTNSGERGQQQRHDASDGQSRGRSDGQSEGGQHREQGSAARRRASFARHFALSTLP